MNNEAGPSGVKRPQLCFKNDKTIVMNSMSHLKIAIAIIGPKMIKMQMNYIHTQLHSEISHHSTTCGFEDISHHFENCSFQL